MALRLIPIILISVGLYLSIFYIYVSGSLQPAHVLLVIGCGMGFLFSWKPSQHMLTIGSPLILTLLLVAYATAVNLVFFGLIGDNAFLVSAAHLVYGGICFSGAFYLLSQGDARSRQIQMIVLALMAGLATNVAIYYLGGGRFEFSARYSAYFNDPNQMSYWALCAFSIIYILALRREHVVVAFLLTSWVVCLGVSRSGLVGLFLVFAGLCFLYFSNLKQQSTWNRFLALIMVAGFAAQLAYVDPRSAMRVNAHEAGTSVSRFERTDVYREMELTGFFRIIDYPKYLLFGAGHGADEKRFHSQLEVHEVHLTWLGILFYYGVVGFALFALTVLRVLRAKGLVEFMVLGGPLAYGMFTYGFRTPIFWVYFALLAAVAVNGSIRRHPEHAVTSNTTK
jgi:hypothetical protein